MKTLKEHLHEKHGHQMQTCDFGLKSHEFNIHRKNLPVAEIGGANKPTRGKPPKGGGGNPASDGVIFLDFTGHTVSGTSWNFSGDIVCAPANITAAKVDEIVANVIAEYAPFRVVVTVDEAVYNAAPPTKRMRVIFTETWEWFGQSGGVAFINSFTWGDNTPCFVFTSLLNYNAKYIKEAAAHEVGHTLGLYHQCTYDANCVKTSDYNSGNGVEAPIMGVGYYVPDAGTKWWIGPDPYGCTHIQDDNAILTAILGLK